MSLRRRKDSTHERIVVEADASLRVLGEALERLRGLLDDDARAYETVEGDARGRAAAVTALRQRFGGYDVYPELGRLVSLGLSTKRGTILTVFRENEAHELR